MRVLLETGNYDFPWNLIFQVLFLFQVLMKENYTDFLFVLHSPLFLPFIQIADL